MRCVLTSAVVVALLAGSMAPGRVEALRQDGDGAKPNFSTQTQLVVLHVAVRDKRGEYVSGLDQDVFRVSENNQRQSISFFHTQDAPVTVGLVIDSSGSMAPNREMVIAASLAFAGAMNPDDEMFVLGFNENIHSPLPAREPFTHDMSTLRSALTDAIKATGQTAVYSAINAGLEYVTRGSFERQVLVVVSDGGDNASSITRNQVFANAQASNAVIYTVALVDPVDTEADPGFLSRLSEATGGVSFRPRNVGEVQAVLQRVARDIRNTYTLGYVPKTATPARKEELRRVAVDVRLPTGQKLDVRTRRAYLAGTPEGNAGDAR